MFQPSISIEFIFLCSIQIGILVFSFMVFLNGLKRYRSTNISEGFLQKSVKYFIFIVLTILIASAWGLLVNIYFAVTSNGVVAGYLYEGIITCILVNIFCAWQFLNYLFHPERRDTKYIVGVAVILGIIFVWLYPGVIVSPLVSPITDNLITYIYPFLLFVIVYSFVSYEFFKHSRSPNKKERYGYRFLGGSALLSIFMFFGFFFGLIYAWFITLNSTILLYLGYSLPRAFLRALKIEE